MGHLIQVSSHASELFDELGKDPADFLKCSNFIRRGNGCSSDCADDIVATLANDIDTCTELFEASFGGDSGEDFYDREEEFLKLAQLRGYSLETARSAFKRFLNS